MSKSVEQAMPGMNNEGKAVSISAIVVVLSLIGVAIVKQPLTPKRPPAEMEPTLQGQGPQKVEARLWQDPFAAVERHRRIELSVASERRSPPSRVETFPEVTNPREKGYSPRLDRSGLPTVVSSRGRERNPKSSNQDALAKTIAERFSGKGTPTVLGVMLFGGPYAEQAELRRRWRYAVVSALATAGYVPEDSNKVGYFEPAKVAGTPRPEVVPYEWFRPGRERAARSPTENEPAPVLLLWLDDNVYASTERPLFSLFSLFLSVHDAARNWKPDLADFSLKIIGPAGTTTLSAMLEEVRAVTDASIGWRKVESAERVDEAVLEHYRNLLNNFASIDILSATATGDDCLLLKQPIECNEDASKQFKRFGEKLGGGISLKPDIRLLRTINTDADLAKALSEELKRRNALTSPGRVVLISEWDTEYGRALPEVMKHHLKGVGGKITIDQVSYLRGLDGQLAQRPENGKGEQDSEDEYEKERASGRARLDYLRRLVKKIEHLDEDRELPVRAIGVLGSDMYDKQLILQALRPVLTDVQYFTTDLDARLLHPEDFRWNRNLIVASSFGLELNSKLQGAIPPFRSGYQSALYFAGLMALDDSLHRDDSIANYLKTQLFEVGREGAFNLTPASRNDEPGLTLAGVDATSLHPPPQRLFPDKDTWWTLLVLASTVILFSVYISSQAKEVLRDLYRKRYKLWFVAATVLFIALVGRMLAVTAGEEPFSLTNGISAWPGMLLQLAAILLTLTFLWFGSRKVNETEQRLDGLILDEECMSGGFTPCLVDWSVYLWGRDRPTENPRGESLWCEYKERARLCRRSLRIAMPVVANMILVAWLFHITAPQIPVRGEYADWAIYALGIASFLSISVLTFYIVDASRLCRRLIELLALPNVQWSEETRARIEKRQQEQVVHDEWLSLEVISETANTVAQLISYPFIVLLVIVASRLSYFDSWGTPALVVVIYLALAVYAFSSVFILHQAAEHARTATIEALEDKLIDIYHEEEFTEEEVQLLIERIRSMEQGAFRPLREQPMIKALLLPFGGLGLLFLEYTDWLN